MIRFETAKPASDGSRVAINEFAKKHKLGEKEAERLFHKLGATATQEELVAEAGIAVAEKVAGRKNVQP